MTATTGRRGAAAAIVAAALAACSPAAEPRAAASPAPPAAGRPSPGPPPPAAGRRLEVTVKRVVDGDTIRVGGLPAGNPLVRLTGINAPETGDGRTTRECYGPESRRWLSERAPAGTRLTLVFDVGERDRFGRVLAYVYDPAGAFLNRELVDAGYARTMRMAPNLRHADELRDAERRARAERRGLWGACR